MILAVTCSIRENAENKIWNRLDYFKSLKRKRPKILPPLKVGLLGGKGGKEREREGREEEGREREVREKGDEGKELHVIFVFLGCMAERLKEKVLETNKQVDIIAGPGEALNHTHQLHPPPQTRTATYPDYWR